MKRSTNIDTTPPLGVKMNLSQEEESTCALPCSFRRRRAVPSFLILVSMISVPSSSGFVGPHQRHRSVSRRSEYLSEYLSNRIPVSQFGMSASSLYAMAREEDKKGVKRKVKRKGAMGKKIKNFTSSMLISQDDDDVSDEKVLPRSVRSEHKIGNGYQNSMKSNIIKASVKETGNDTLSRYLKSMGSHELLSLEDELVLGKQIQTLVKWESGRQLLEVELMRAPTNEEWAAYISIPITAFQKQLERSQKAKTALMEANLRLVISIARQNTKSRRENASFSSICFQDTCQQGILGLAKACDKFDPSKGFRFSTYANWWIQREIKESLADQSRTFKLPYHVVKVINKIQIMEVTLRKEMGRKPSDEELAEKLEMSVKKLHFYQKSAEDAISIDKELHAKKGKGSAASGGGDGGKTNFSMNDTLRDPSTSPSDFAGSEMLKDDVGRLIGTLDPREQAVIRLRFGLVEDGEPKTLAEIASKFKSTKEYIQGVEAKALLKLRQPYRNQSVKCYVSDL